MRIVNERASVRVPASALLFNSEFSSIAISLDLWDEISATLTTGASKAVLLGQGSSDLPKDATHPIIQVMLRVLAHLGQPGVGIELVCRNNIPRGIGLGNSEADVLAGILLVRALLGMPTEFDDLLIEELAAEFSVQPARFTAAFAGGAQIAWLRKGDVAKTAPLHLSELLHLNLIFPNQQQVQPVMHPVQATVPAGASALLIYALAHCPLALRDVAQAAHSAVQGAQIELAASDKTGLNQLLDALQRAGWPALGISDSAAIIVFAQLQGTMQADFTAAGCSVIPLKAALGARGLS